MDSSVLIKIRCTQQNLNFIRKPPLAAGDKNATKIEWVFCNIWKGYAKTALFSCKKTGGKVIPMIVENNICVVPPEVLKRRGKFYVSVRGDKDGMILTSNTLEYEIGPSLVIGEIIPTDTTPDIYNQLVSLINKKADNITFNAEDSTIQLSANGALIGDKIKVSANGNNSITKLEVNENGELVATYTDGTTDNIGKVGSDCPGIYVPSITENGILTFSLQDKPSEENVQYDLNPHDDWNTIDGSTQYIWEVLE